MSRACVTHAHNPPPPCFDKSKKKQPAAGATAAAAAAPLTIASSTCLENDDCLFSFFLRWDAFVHRSQRAPPPRPPDVHALPDAGAGEGVPHQPLPHPATAHRDGAPALSDGAPNKDLVPEPAYEAQEGDPGHQGAERAGEASAGRQGDGCPTRRPRRRGPRAPLKLIATTVEGTNRVKRQQPITVRRQQQQKRSIRLRAALCVCCVHGRQMYKKRRRK